MVKHTILLPCDFFLVGTFREDSWGHHNYLGIHSLISDQKTSSACGEKLSASFVLRSARASTQVEQVPDVYMAFHKKGVPER